MAAKKTTTRASAGSGKKKGLLKRINFTSRKVQFVLVILLFGLAGGGFAVYKSFAASQSWTYRPEDNTLVANTYKKCSAATLPDKTKNNAPVIVMGCQANDSFGLISMKSGSISGKIRICALIKGSGKVYMSFSQREGTGGSILISDKINSANYSSVCIPYQNVSHSAKVSGSVGCEGVCQISVRSITLEKI